MKKNIKEYQPARYNLNRTINNLVAPGEYAFAPSALIVQEKKFPDVSFYQKYINWDTMRTQTDAAIIRAGQNLWEDPQFRRNWTEAKRVGIKRGAYWFYDDRIDPGRQAQFLVNLLQADLPEMEIWIDWENSYSGAFSSLANVVAMMQAVEKALPSCRVGMYTGYYWFVDHSNAVANAGQYTYLKAHPLWLAWYTTSASIVKIPAPWTSLQLWQYGTPAIGSQYGVQTIEIDMNFFNGTQADFDQRYGSIPEPQMGEQGMYSGLITTDAKVWDRIGGTQIATLKPGTVIAGDGYSTDRVYFHLTSPQLGWTKAAWINVSPVTEPPPPPPPPVSTVTLTHTILVYDDGSITIDGNPYQ